MQELIQITTNNQGLKVVSARELYAFLGYESNKFARWAKSKILENDFAIENEDWQGLDINVQGNITKDYALSIDFSKRLSQMARTAKGEEIRNYFIECEKQLQTPKELSRKDILLLALESEERAILAETKILELQPKVEAFDRVIDNSTTYTLDTVSDIINIGRNKLSEKLKQIGWAVKDSSKGTSSTRKVEEIGYARTFFETIVNGQKELKVKKIVITKKGLDYLVNNYSKIFA
jgi:phage anti-repressor protein/phage antirepressor YoqD-like protein